MTGARTVATVAAALAVPLCARGLVPLAAAQDSPTIRNAVQLAAEGRGDSARRIVAAALARSRPGESAYIEALYWRGRLATSGDSAEGDLRRVAIEYSTSRWADHALLQLAQLAMAAGNSAGALQLAQRLRSDYPGSGLRPRAALWAGRAAFEVGDPVVACALLDSARSEAADDVEFRNQVAFYRGRCPAASAISRPGPDRPPPAPPTDTARPAAGGNTTTRVAPPLAPAPPRSRPDSTATPPIGRAAPFEVQVAATRSPSTARALLARLKKAGQHGRVVTGADGYLRVRAGPYSTRRDAAAAADRLRRALGGHPIIVTAP